MDVDVELAKQATPATGVVFGDETGIPFTVQSAHFTATVIPTLRHGQHLEVSTWRTIRRLPKTSKDFQVE